MAYYLHKTCETCGGDGVVTITYPPGDVECWNCGGAGTNAIGEMAILDTDVADILDKCNDLKEKVDEIKEVCDDILEKVNEE